MAILVSLFDLVPHRTDRTPIAKSTFFRLMALVAPAQRAFAADKRTSDLLDANKLLKHIGCSPKTCFSPKAKEPMHLYYHLLVECLDHVDGTGHTVQNVGQSCINCTAGIMDNRQRQAWLMAHPIERPDDVPPPVVVSNHLGLVTDTKSA